MMLRRRHRLADEVPQVQLDTAPYKGLRKPDLQKIAADRGLPTDGKVAELVDRLAAHDLEQPAPSETEVEVTDEVGETVEPEVQDGEEPDSADESDVDEPAGDDEQS